MATKPNETYKWGENATHEPVGAYEDTGWPSDIIPPKRTQFNWYQNLVGRWLGWAEDAVDEIVETVLERWFTVVHTEGVDWQDVIPNESGLYDVRYGESAPNAGRWFVIVVKGFAFAILLRSSTGNVQSQLSQLFGVWDDGLNQWVNEYTFTHSNSRTDILQESESNYVTPKGLVEYFNVRSTLYANPSLVPHQTGVYFIGSVGVSIVIGDIQMYMPLDESVTGMSYAWDGNGWV